MGLHTVLDEHKYNMWHRRKVGQNDETWYAGNINKSYIIWFPFYLNFNQNKNADDDDDDKYFKIMTSLSKEIIKPSAWQIEMRNYQRILKNKENYSFNCQNSRKEHEFWHEIKW